MADDPLHRPDNPLRHLAYRLLDCPSTGGPVRRGVDAFLLFLILANTAAVLFDHLIVTGSPWRPWLLGFEYLSVAVFTIEYGIRVWTAAEHEDWRDRSPIGARLAYVVSPMGLIDLIAIVPFFLGVLLSFDLRYLRLVRLFRLLKLTRYSPALQSLAGAFYQERRSFLGAFLIVMVALLTSASLMHIVEADAQPEVFGTLPDAMYWAIITLATVGYGDVVPHTALGKLIAGASALAGLVLFGLPAGIMASGFVEQIKRRDFVVNAKLVSQVPLFAGIGVTHLVEIATVLKPRMVPPLYTVVRKGDPSDCMYFVLSGELEVDIKPNPVRLGPGTFFGEMGLLYLTPRTATVRSVTDTQLLVLDEHDFSKMTRAFPDMRAAIELEASRRGAGPAKIAKAS